MTATKMMYICWVLALCLSIVVASAQEKKQNISDDDDVVLCNEQGCGGSGESSFEEFEVEKEKEYSGETIYIRERPSNDQEDAQKRKKEPSKLERWLSTDKAGQSLKDFILRMDVTLIDSDACVIEAEEDSASEASNNNNNNNNDDDEVFSRLLLDSHAHVMSLLSTNDTFMEWALQKSVADGVKSYQWRSYGAHVYVLGNDEFASVNWFASSDNEQSDEHALSWQVAEGDTRFVGSNWLLLEWAAATAKTEFPSCQLFGIDVDSDQRRVYALPPWLHYVALRAEASAVADIWPQLAKMDALRRRFASVRDIEHALFDQDGFWRDANVALDGDVMSFDQLLDANFLRDAGTNAASLDRHAFARRFFALRRREALMHSITQSRPATFALPEQGVEPMLLQGNEAAWRTASLEQRIGAVGDVAGIIASGRLPRGFRHLASACWSIPADHPIASRFSDAHFQARIFCLLASNRYLLPNYVQHFLFGLDWAQIFQ